MHRNKNLHAKIHFLKFFYWLAHCSDCSLVSDMLKSSQDHYKDRKTKQGTKRNKKQQKQKRQKTNKKKNALQITST